METSPLTLVSSSVVSAADAGSGSLLALVSMPVTLAGPAAGEAPVTRLTSVAALTVCSRAALALTGKLVTKSSHRSFQATRTGWTERKKDVRRMRGHDE